MTRVPYKLASSKSFSGPTGKTLGIRDLVIQKAHLRNRYFSPVLLPSPIVPLVIQTTGLLFRVVVFHRLCETPGISIKLTVPKVSSQRIPPQFRSAVEPRNQNFKVPTLDSDVRQLGNYWLRRQGEGRCMLCVRNQFKLHLSKNQYML